MSTSTLTSAATASGGGENPAKARRLGGIAAAGGLAIALLMSSSAFSGASAFWFDFGPGPGYSPAPRPVPKPRKPRRIDRIDPSEKHIQSLASGSLQIVIAINKQQLTLYSNGVAVAHSMVSTGVPGHSTPTGVFSVIQKERFHRSNLYSAAPMPFMQRITWSGVALHEGIVPGHPASHGCIRMPGAFARQMWTTTKLGVRVIISPTEIAPMEIESPRLFVPKQPEVTPPPDVPVADQPSRRAGAQNNVKTAEVIDRKTATDAVKLRGAVGDTAPKPNARLIAKILAAAATLTEKLTAGIGVAGSAISSKVVDVATNAHAIAVAKKAADHIKLVETMRKAGPISVFISRKEKKLFVRHKFTPLFDVPVTIRDASAPLGTHVYTALELKDGGTAMRWNVVTLPTADANVEPPRKHGRRSWRREREEETPAPVVSSPASALAALERIEIGKEALDRIGELLTAGASLTISDHGLGPETGRGTDFIVVTR